MEQDIEDGHPRFKKRFSEVVRAGMRLVSNEQVSLVMRLESLRAKARARSNNAMLMQLEVDMDTLNHAQ